MGCDYVIGNDIEVCAAFGNSARVSALFEAQLSEWNMGGNLCGVNTGEALSRWCAASVSNNALSDFATAPRLLSQNFALSTIAQGLVTLDANGTFAQLYGNLTNNDPNTAFLTFLGAVQGLNGGVTSDDPFGALASVRTGLAAFRPRSHRLLPPGSDGDGFLRLLKRYRRAKGKLLAVIEPQSDRALTAADLELGLRFLRRPLAPESSASLFHRPGCRSSSSPSASATSCRRPVVMGDDRPFRRLCATANRARVHQQSLQTAGQPHRVPIKRVAPLDRSGRCQIT
jgi:hypothetical protein